MSELIKTIKLYDNDSHEKEFTALVQSCTKSGDFFKIELDRTAFFPEGGGQYGDTGVLTCDGRTVKVCDTQIDGTSIYHLTMEEILPGTQVEGALDWDKRFSRMQSHSAEHIISGLIHSTFGYDNIGFHLGDEDVTCDYNGSFSKEQLKDIEKRANEVIFSNLPIKTEYPDAKALKSIDYRSKLDLEGDVRIVTIPGVDCCACCAPHVKQTGEIGLVKIIYTEKSHGGVRLHICAGHRALADYDEKQENILRIMDLLSARQFETADAVSNLQKANGDLTYELGKASRALAQARLDAVDKVSGNLVLFLQNADTEALRALANGGREKCAGVCVALTNCEDGYRYMITSKDIPLRALSRDFNACLVGRGGGKDDMIQGVFVSELSVIEDFFEHWNYTE